MSACPSGAYCGNEEALNAAQDDILQLQEMAKAEVKIYRELRENYAALEKQNQKMKDVLWEAAHHLYDTQDMNRVRELAKEVLEDMPNEKENA